ncbi:hypothetical protein HYY74_04100 [Candidatus Woesearchaeota archaeon]|nr:hypothetical protein [Candidatus Woesearchaeota archaeon]
MNQDEIISLANQGIIRKRILDKNRSESLIKADFINADFAKMTQITDRTATGIFREMYKAFRQLGDAKWWMLGYEPVDSHKVSMKILMSANIEKNFKLKSLDRFRQIRNDSNYRGYLVKEKEAVEIVALWDEVSKDLVDWVKK